jgi:hypothetical protein
VALIFGNRVNGGVIRRVGWGASSGSPTKKKKFQRKIIGEKKKRIK